MKRNGCAIKGNIETQMNRPDIKSRNVIMRNELDLFVNVVRCRSQPGVKTRHDGIDVVTIRQNTEGDIGDDTDAPDGTFCKLNERDKLGFKHVIN